MNVVKVRKTKLYGNKTPSSWMSILSQKPERDEMFSAVVESVPLVFVCVVLDQQKHWRIKPATRHLARIFDTWLETEQLRSSNSRTLQRNTCPWSGTSRPFFHTNKCFGHLFQNISPTKLYFVSGLFLGDKDNDRDQTSRRKCGNWACRTCTNLVTHSSHMSRTAAISMLLETIGKTHPPTTIKLDHRI